jgi:hypothetical protein
MYFKIYIIELSFCLETIIHVTILEYVLFAYMRHFDKRQTRNYLNLFTMKIKRIVSICADFRKCVNAT